MKPAWARELLLARHVSPKPNWPLSIPSCSAAKAQLFWSLAFVVVFITFTPQAWSATVVLNAAYDNTLYENPSGSLSNGQGDFFFAGKTQEDSLRRGLISFDLSSLPEGARITGVVLTLFLSQTPFHAPTPTDISLHAMTANWGEGTSNATGPEGLGQTASMGDATWLHRFFGGATWNSAGGDFVPIPSATTEVTAEGNTYSWTGAGLASDVQDWLDNPSTNFGWAVIGEESVTVSARRFNSRSNPDLATRPQLIVEYEIVPEPSTALLAIAGAVVLGSGRRARRYVLALLIVAGVAVGSGTANAQNPIPEVISKGSIHVELEQVATGLTAPALFLSAPGDTMRQYVVEQGGAVRVIENGVLLGSPFMDVSSRMVSLRTGYDERGFLGMAFDPGFADPASPGFGRIFTYTSEPATGGAADYPVPFGGTTDHHSVVASWRVDPSNPSRIDPGSRVELLRFGQPQFNHNGGMIAFGPDGYLYIGSGDGGSSNDTGSGHNPTIGNAQDASTLLGKMLRIDVNGTNSANGRYGIPANNPFANGGGAPEIYATGFRNPYRFSFDGESLLVGDVGQNNIEEVDRVELGKDYGWRYKEGTFRFDPVTGTVSSDVSGLPTDLVDPILQYDHDEGISIIGGFVYRGTLVPELGGKYIFGDFARSFTTPNGRLFYGDLETQEIHEFIIGGSDTPLGLFVKGIGQDLNGEIYVLGSTVLGPIGTTGTVLKIVPEPSATLSCAVAACLVFARRRRAVERLS